MTITVPVIPCVITLFSTFAFLVATSEEEPAIVTIAAAICAGFIFLASYGLCSLIGLL